MGDLPFSETFSLRKWLPAPARTSAQSEVLKSFERGEPVFRLVFPAL
jgi:hypothetical protein